MKLLKTTLLFAALLSLIIACDSPETTTAEETITQEPIQQETAESAVEKPAPAVEKQDDRTTLEGFWAAVQEAVANNDKEALKLLSHPYANTFLLIIGDYQQLIAATKATDFKESTREENGKKLYEYMITMHYEDVLEENQPSTTIYIWKKEDGSFELFNILEAG